MSGLEEACHFSTSRDTTLRRGSLTIDDCIPGVIVFIKKCQYIIHQDFVESGLSISGLRHPALVIKRVESKASHVLVCPLTTFGGRTVQERYPHNRMQRKNYLPIYPRSPITPRGIQLYTAGEPLKKPGYISIADTYIVHSDMLRAYDWDFAVGQFRLTEASFGQVIQELDRRQRVGGSIANFGTIPGHTTSEQNPDSLTAQDISLHTVSKLREIETPFLPISNHDIGCSYPPSPVSPLPGKLISAVCLIMFLMACLVVGLLLSSS